MARIDRYIVAQLLVLFGTFALILVGVYWINRAVRLFDQLISNGHSAVVFLQLTTLSLPDLVRFVIPLAAFFAVIWGINRMNSDSEFVILQSNGFSPWRLSRPLLIFGLIVAIMHAILAHWLSPISLAELRERQGVLSQDVTVRFLRDGEFVHPSTGLTLFISEITPDGAMKRMFLSDLQDPNAHVTYSAERASLVTQNGKSLLVMFEGTAQTYLTKTQELSTTAFADAVIDISEFTSTSPSQNTPVALRTSQTLYQQATAGDAINHNLLRRIHQRIASSLLVPAAALLGFASLLLGGFSRFGQWRQLALAVVLIAIVMALDNSMTAIAIRSGGNWWAHYLAPLVAAGIAIGLIWISTKPTLSLSRLSARLIKGPST